MSKFCLFKKSWIFCVACITFFTFISSSAFSQTDYLISTGGTVYVSSGDRFYDAGGPSGNDGNTSYTMTLCPATPGEKVVVDFTYFESTWNDLWSEEDPLFIYDGPTATGNDIGELKGNYSVKYNTGVNPYGMGVEAFAPFPFIGTPTMFSATNSTGCLTFRFENNETEQNIGWEANILTYTAIEEPGCVIGISADNDSVCNGDAVLLTANGTVSNAPINNDFNSGTIGTGWSATSSASFTNNACSTPSLDGSTYLWMQSAPGPRALVTNVMDASMGGTVSFEYRQARNNGDSSPCESPDQGSGTFEGIYLQYSTDGSTWTTFKYIYPNGTEGSFGAEGGLTGCGNYVKNWTKMTYPIPVAAQSATTQFRWVQAKVTSSSTDNWGLDNVVIAIPTGSYTVTIEDLSTSTIIASQVDGEATVTVNPTTTTTYRATVDDGTSSCFEDITVYVADPIVVSCGTSTATSVQFDWTAANGATSYDYSYSVNAGAPVTGNTSANTINITPVASGSNVELTVTPVNAICSDPVTAICSTSGCVSPTADAGATFVLDCNTSSANLDGSASSTGAGFTYAWSTPDGNIVSGGNTLTPLINQAGTYTLTVTNTSGGCIDTDNVTITQNTTPPTAGITNNTGTTVLNCNTTLISLTATGGGTYAWSGGSSPATAGNTVNSAGNYTVTVTGANGCTDTESINITQNTTPPTAGITNNTGTTVLNCNTTSISLTATGGGTYAWSGGSTPATAGNTVNSAGNYTVTVTGANGCTDTESINITQNTTPPTAGITNNTGTTDLTCITTIIDLTATGGVNYSWNGGTNSGSANNSFVSPGNYTVTVTGANGCTDTENILITQSAVPPVAAITNNSGTTELNCTNTFISLTATGGGIYAWSGGSTPATANNVITAPGLYSVTVTLVNGCTDSEIINITQNTTPPTAGITNNTGTIVLDCNTTSINLTATGGGTYVWSGGVTPATAANIISSVGNYTVTVTGANGCTDTESINITQNITPPTAGITNNTGTTVLNCNTTSISLTATGGGTYSWSGGSSMATAGNTVNSAGNYTVTVTGTNGCTDTESINITQNITPPTAGITNNTGTTVLNCNTASISLTATGGGTYSWSGGSSPGTAGNTVNSAGNYTVTVTGANGCTDTESINITQNITPPTAGITNNTGTTVLDCNTTSISLTATGGGTYAWSGGATPTIAGNNVNSIGNYTVTVTGANGCTGTESINITQNTTPPTAGITNNTGITVLDCNTTSISLTATGGGTYTWSGGATPATAGNTVNSAGNYTVTVTGANGCTDTESINITQNTTPPTAGITNNTGTTVLNCNTTSISLTATGGGTYAWSGGSSPATAGNTVNSAGNYTVTVTGTNGCTDTESINITQIPALQLTLSGFNAICGGAGGTVNSQVSGGSPSYDYLWSNSAISASINNVAPGYYTLTVTDSDNCTISQTYEIDNSGSINASIQQIQGLGCNGDETGILLANSSNAVLPALYNWSTGSTNAQISGLGAGDYRVTVTDNWGCSGIASTSLIDPQGMMINVNVNSVSCHGDEDGSISLSVSGGNFPYDYLWNNSLTSANIADLSSGTYTVTVTDNQNCTVTGEYVIVNPEKIDLNLNLTNIECFGLANGSIVMTASGGTEPYNFSLMFNNNVINGREQTGLSAGNYTAQVVDNNNCITTIAASILEPSELQLSYETYNPSCRGNDDGYVHILAIGGTAPYLYMWDSYIMDTGMISGLEEGVYNFTVIDGNNCEKKLDLISLSDTEVDCIRIPNAFTPNSDGINDEWLIQNIELFPEAQINIFNRWGQVMYSGLGSSDPWDGQYNGKFVPAGSYVYTVNLYTSEKTYNGVVTVVY